VARVQTIEVLMFPTDDLSTSGASNLRGNFAFSMGAEEALRSVLRALSIFQRLNHLPAAKPSPQLYRNVTIAAKN
jgi:hypothetical protein